MLFSAFLLAVILLRRALSLEAFFLCITFVFAALSKALKTEGKDLTEGFFLNADTASLNFFLILKLKIVFRLSCLTFLIACFVTGMALKFLSTNF